jgi:hypothetical protein
MYWQQHLFILMSVHAAHFLTRFTIRNTHTKGYGADLKLEK